MAYAPIVLSGTPASGRVIPVVQTITPGTLIHTAHATSLDRIYLWAVNATDVAAWLTLEWGGVLDPGDHCCREVTIRPHSLPRPVATGQILTGALVLRAFSSRASTINLFGFVSRYTA